MIEQVVIDEINAFLHHKAPGLTLDLQDNPAFDSTTLRLGVKVELTKLISNSLNATEVGTTVVDMLAEVQKAAVTAIGLEGYIRSRELAVLDRLRERVEENIGTISKDGIDPIEAAYRELGGTPPMKEE